MRTELLPLHIAFLEGRLQQIRQEWDRLGEWADADQMLLTDVRAQTARVQALLDHPGPGDQQVQNALTELLVIGHLQRLLLEQSIRLGAGERSRLQGEGSRAQAAITALRLDKAVSS